MSFEDARSQAEQVHIASDVLHVIGLVALRTNKRASGRSKDRDDLKRLPDPDALPRPRRAGKKRG